MDEKLPASSGTHHEDSFDTAVRGYNRQQVLDYMARTGQMVAKLEQHLAAARADSERARADADFSRAEAERLQQQAAESKPVHEEVSGRLSQILRLAAEEADQERATADAEIAQLRSEAQAETERLLAEAHAQAEQELAAARETAERELADARARAERDLTSARDEAERLRVVSVRQADELLDEAQRRSGAINDISSQRLETPTATHGEAVLRLGQIRDVLADLLDRDAAAGSLAQVVEAVISPPPATAPEIDPDPVTEVQPAVEVTAVQGLAAAPELDQGDAGESGSEGFYTRVPRADVLDVEVEDDEVEKVEVGRHAAQALGGVSEPPGPAPRPTIDLRDRGGVSSRR